MIISRILLDLDEVLVDFVGPACRLHGLTNAQISRVRGRSLKSGWDIVPLMAEVVGRSFDAEEFWRPITGNYQFWENLPLLPWYQELLHIAIVHADDWYIVTSPSLCPSSNYGKARWALNHLGRLASKVVPTSHKHLMANERTLLIDDRPASIEKFRANDGHGIIFPALGNSWCPVDQISHVTSELEKMLCT